MDIILKNRIVRVSFVVIISLLFSLIINRGFLIINSVVGNEYKTIFSATSLTELGRLGHRILTPVLSRIFGDIFIFNIFVIFSWLFYLCNKLYEKYDLLSLFLISASFTSTQLVLFTLNFAYYPDPLTVFLATVALFNLRNNYIFLFLGILILLNNEVGFFIFLFLSLVSTDLLNKLKLTSIVLIVYLLYRFIIELSIQNQSSNILSYLNELKNFDINFFMLFGLFTGLKFTFLITLFAKKKILIFSYLIFYILVPANMAVDYTRYGSILVILIIWILIDDEFNKVSYLKLILVFVIIFNVITPKYYVWDNQILYLRDSRIHFFDILGNSFFERDLASN